MTVKDLIEALSVLPPHTVVFMTGGKDDDTDNGPLTDVLTGPHDTDDGTVLLVRELD